MDYVIQVIVVVAALAIFAWLLISLKKTAKGDQPIDASDARQIGTLVGLMGGSNDDAAIAQNALRRFEEEHGRKATVKEMGVVAGMMRSGGGG
jgi:hypothetical protein